MVLLFNFKLGFEFQIPITYYWKAINFCVLNYRLPANLLIFSRRTFTFFLHFFRICYIKIHMICKQKLLYFFFPVYTYFISFSYFIVLPSTSSTILNRSGWKVHPSLALNLDGKTFSFSQLIMILAVGFLWMLFIKLRKSLFLICSEFLIVNECDIFFIYQDVHIIFLL